MKYTDEVLDIAKFMGLVPIKGVSFSGLIYYYYNDPIFEDFACLPCYDSWDEIMLVVDKIEKDYDVKFIIYSDCVLINDNTIYGKNRLDAVIKGVNYYLKFIE